MSYWWDVYRANLKMAVAQMLQYRFAILIWAVWGFVGPLISLAVWTAATAARGGTIQSAGGATFDRADFAAYFLVFLIVGHLTMSWDAFEFATRVRDGSTAVALGDTRILGIRLNDGTINNPMAEFIACIWFRL